MNAKNTALILLDLQNDYMHRTGALARGNMELADSRSLVEQLIKVVTAFRETEGKIIAANFTLIADKDSKPLITPSLKEAWPFLTRGDFQIGRRGHQLIDELDPADYLINKIVPSAFALTHLDWLLRQLDIDTVVIAGLINEDGVAATAKDAKELGYKAVVLKNGCAAFDKAAIKSTMLEAKEYATTITCAELLAKIK